MSSDRPITRRHTEEITVFEQDSMAHFTKDKELAGISHLCGGGKKDCQGDEALSPQSHRAQPRPPRH
jgi:hypothetical protein